MESRGKRALNSCGRLTRTRCPLLASSLMPLLPVPLIAGKSRRSLKLKESTVVFACGVQVCIGGVLGVGWGNSNDEGLPSSTQPRAEEPVGHPQV